MQLSQMLLWFPILTKAAARFRIQNMSSCRSSGKEMVSVKGLWSQGNWTGTAPVLGTVHLLGNGPGEKTGLCLG